MSRPRRAADASRWFEPGSDENLVRETIESLSVFGDPDRWLRRLQMLRERIPYERQQALAEKRSAKMPPEPRDDGS